MRKLLLIGILLFTSFIIFGQINDYVFTFIRTIPNGSKPGLIGWSERAFRVGGFPGPLTFTISKDNKMYISDQINWRVNVYDLDINYISTIIENTENKESHYAHILKIDVNNNLIFIGPNAVVKLRDNGDSVYYIEKGDLPANALSSRNFFPIDDHVFFYDEYGYVRSIDPEGVIQKPGRSMEVLNEINQRQSGINQQSGDASSFRMSEGTVQVPNSLRQDRKHIIVGNQFFSTDEYRVREYFDKLKEDSVSARNLNAEASRGSDIDVSELWAITLIGYDNDHNGYWTGVEKSTRKQLVLIYSKIGTILDAFYYGDINEMKAKDERPRKVAVAPNGDVYFMRNDEKGSHFWKVERRW